MMRSRRSGMKLEFLKEKESCNYIYFGFFLAILLSLNSYHVLTINQGSLFSKCFFLVCNIGQLLVEVMLIIVCSTVLKKYTPPWVHALYIGGIFTFLFSQIVEAVLVKVMDVSLSEAIDIAFGADFANFIELLRLADIGMDVWAALCVVAIAFPFLGIFLYKATAKISCKKPLYCKRSSFLGVLVGIPFVLSFVDYFASNRLLSEEYGEYKKTLPWKGTFFKIPTDKIALKSPLEKYPQIQISLDEIRQHDLEKSKKPNIYLFVVESLRQDYITEQTAPNLVKFKQNHISATHSFSNANSTINSWFSIFYSSYPFHWSYAKTASLMQGSLPLNILKRMGYKIHVYSSAQLKYYDFEQVMLGKDRAMADTFKVFPHHGDKLASESDIEAIEAFQKDIKDHPKEGNIYIIFLDSTHFNYSWPQDFQQKFTPAGKVTWEHRLTNDLSKLSVLKNRYKNSIAFVDHLFAKVTQQLKDLRLYEESVIVFCGDHGEEFKEQGKLFHASHLNNMQIKIPLFYKFGDAKAKVAISSHIDIFPSIIHYIDQDQRLLKHFDGHSVLDSNRPSFAVAARYNACFHPYEFLIHNGNGYLKLRFEKKNQIFSSKFLKILGFHENFQEKKISTEEALSLFSQELSHIFEID